MGKVTVKRRLANNGGLFTYELKLSRGKPRQVEVEALVDTGATHLHLKPSSVKALGLRKVEEVPSHPTNSPGFRGGR